MKQNPKIIFFGTPDYAVTVLEALKNAGMTPGLVVTMPDRPAGKKLMVTPPPVKIWAEKNNVPVIQPENLKDENFLNILKDKNFDVGVVIAYGKIIPQEIIDTPKHGILNIHGSLLPKLRGASPIETAILQDEKETGVTIMLVDNKMDHGPILAKQEVVMETWPPTAQELGEKIVKTGAELLVKIIPEWISGAMKAEEQDHTQATYTTKIEKSDGEINLSDDHYKNYLKIQAYSQWPTAFFFTEKNGKKIRVIITKAEYKDGKLNILRVIPEGKKEVDYQIFNR